MSKQSSDPWRITWEFVTSDGVLVVLLLAVAASVTLTTWVPQRSSSGVDHEQWLSQIHASYGEFTLMMRRLGLFSITRSAGFHVLLALLSGCLLLRLVEKVGQLRHSREIAQRTGDWKGISGRQLDELLDDLRVRRYRVVSKSSFFQADHWPWADLCPLAAHAGGLLLLVGLLLWQLWGWHVGGVVLQGGQRLTMPEGDHWVALAESGESVSHSSGVVPFVQTRGPGVRVRAADDEGQLLPLEVTAQENPSDEVMIPLTGEESFAIREARLVAQLSPESEEAYAHVRIQIYRSPSGEVIAETVTDQGGETELTVKDITVQLTPAPYVELTVTHNPGRWPAGVGLLLLMTGLVGNILWPGHRFWLREGKKTIEGAGRIPSWLLSPEEGV